MLEALVLTTSATACPQVPESLDGFRYGLNPRSYASTGQAVRDVPSPP